MQIQDNVLKAYLKNVYFISGTPCGSKTTASRALSRRHGIALYDVDEHFPDHRRLSCSKFQPAMNRQFESVDAFFGRSVQEYVQWLNDSAREQLDFALLDLIQLSRHEVVLCDCNLTPAEAGRLTEPSRIAFLIREPSNLVEEYCARPDHSDFRDFLHSAADVEAAKRTCGEALRQVNAAPYAEIRASSYFWLERTERSTIEQTVRAIERHFHWDEAV